MGPAGPTTRRSTGWEVLLPASTFAGGTYVPGTPLEVRLQVSAPAGGATQLSATVWATGSTQPATPTVTRSDSTASLQAAGGVAVTAYLSGSATRPAGIQVSGFSARPIA